MAVRENPRELVLALVLLCAGAGVLCGAPEPATITVTGWFSDSRCAPATLTREQIGPNGRECVRKCLAEGASLVFIDEKARVLRPVANPEAARDQESHHVAVRATLAGDGNTLVVQSVKVLEPYRASCSVPKKSR
jgi:hypothetical protein